MGRKFYQEEQKTRFRIFTICYLFTFIKSIKMVGYGYNSLI